MATHLVEDHLGVSADGYDAAIRRFVPHYPEMLRTTVETVAAALDAELLNGSSSPLIVELGVGTGALTDALAQRLPGVNFLAVDCDARMLAAARQRLDRWGERVGFREASFDGALPANCAAVVASLALHHVRDLAAKTALYRRICAALAPGGIFVHADAMLAANGPARAIALAAWVGHQTSCGIPETEARNNLETWQREEDRYFGFDEEIRALAQAGFAPAGTDVTWRRGPMAILVAVRMPS